MGLLVNGKWEDRWYDTATTGGRFVRDARTFRDIVSADGSTGHRAELGRYHLYVSLACPWAHRTLIFRQLKGLCGVIGVSVVEPLMLDRGWVFGKDGDPLRGIGALSELYVAAQADFTGRVTVPVLWDKERQTIVNNESSEIIRMFNNAFDRWAAPADFYPRELREEIDRINERVYHDVNDGVYRAGFATTQQAHEEAVRELFSTLDWLERRLADQRYLLGEKITEADWRLFTTLIRFDAVYHGHFKCNLRRIVDYPHLWGYLRELYNWPGVAATVDFDHIKRHYYGSHTTINPSGLVPLGPQLDLSRPPASASSRGL